MRMSTSLSMVSSPRATEPNSRTFPAPCRAAMRRISSRRSRICSWTLTQLILSPLPSCAHRAFASAVENRREVLPAPSGNRRRYAIVHSIRKSAQLGRIATSYVLLPQDVLSPLDKDSSVKIYEIQPRIALAQGLNEMFAFSLILYQHIAVVYGTFAWSRGQRFQVEGYGGHFSARRHRGQGQSPR